MEDLHLLLMRMKSIWFLTRPFGEIHVYFRLGCCWKIVFGFIFPLHTFTNFCIEVASYHDDGSLWDAFKSVLELVVKILKLIISGCGGWCIDLLNDGKVNWLRLDSDGDDPVTDWVVT